MDIEDVDVEADSVRASGLGLHLNPAGQELPAAEDWLDPVADVVPAGGFDVAGHLVFVLEHARVV